MGKPTIIGVLIAVCTNRCCLHLGSRWRSGIGTKPGSGFLSGSGSLFWSWFIVLVHCSVSGSLFWVIVLFLVQWSGPDSLFWSWIIVLASKCD